MEPKCCYCGEIIDLPLRLAEEAKRIAGGGQADCGRGQATVGGGRETASHRPHSCLNPDQSANGFERRRGVAFHGVAFHGRLRLDGLENPCPSGLTWTWALALPVVLFVLFLLVFGWILIKSFG